jgi:hypothetical protein
MVYVIGRVGCRLSLLGLCLFWLFPLDLLGWCRWRFAADAS